MVAPVQPFNRGELRRSIGKIMDIVTVGVVTSTEDSSSLIDTKYLRGGDDEHNEKQVMIYDAAGSIADGEISFVSDYAGSTSDATCAPVFSAAITALDKYEMWKVPLLIDDINDLINQAINEISRDCFIDKQTVNNITKPSTYEYPWVNGFAEGDDFIGVYSIEYCQEPVTDEVIEDCAAVWTEFVDTDVTATQSTTLGAEGNGCLKLVAAAGLAATDIMASNALASTDISNCDQLEIWVYSTVALASGDLQVLLDNTALCASPVESLDIPATLANTGTYHVIDLANAHLDTAIISVGIKHVTDMGAFTLYVDRIHAVDSNSRLYKGLPGEYWTLVKDTTKKIKVTASGLSLMGTPTPVRLLGYQLPALFTDDTTDTTIDSDFIIARTVGRLLIGHAKSSRLDIEDKEGKAKYWLSIAENIKTPIRTQIKSDTRWV